MDTIDQNVIESIIRLVLAVEYPWKSILSCQLQNATLRTEWLTNACFLYFSIPECCEKINGIPRVPLTILIEYGCIDKTTILLKGPQMITFSNNSPFSPIQCNVHILDGYLNEIEVFTVDGTILQPNHISEGKCYYMFKSYDNVTKG